MKLLDILKHERTSLFLVFMGLFLILFAVTTFLWLEIDFNSEAKINSGKFGQIGDFVGGIVGSIWALAGVLLFYIALTEQRKDIKINQDTLTNQIKSLDLQKNELEETKKVLKAQSKTFHIQQFESTFFNMMNLLQDIINSMENELQGKNIKGRAYFKNSFGKLKRVQQQYENQENGVAPILRLQALHEGILQGTINIDEKSINEDDVNKYKVKAIEIYEEFYMEQHNELGHYFRFLYNLFKFVIESKITEKERTRYLNILQAQMSNYELGLLFYNALSKHGGTKFRNWLENYNFLENIDRRALLSPFVHAKFYPSTKFKFMSDISL